MQSLRRQSFSSDAKLYNSVVGKECFIGAGCTIRNSVLLPGVTIKSGSTIVNAIVDPHSITIMEDPI